MAPMKEKNSGAQAMVALRNKKYGKKWLKANAKKAAKARHAKKKKDGTRE